MDNKSTLETIQQRSSKYASTTYRLQKEAEDIITELSLLTGLTKDKIRIAVISQFRFVRDVMRLTKKPDNEDFNIEDYKSTIIRRLGKFTVKPSFKKKHTKVNNNIKENE